MTIRTDKLLPRTLCVWNEPDGSGFWNSSSGMAELKALRAVIRAQIALWAAAPHSPDPPSEASA